MRIPILLFSVLAFFSNEVRADMAATSDAGTTAVSLDGQWQSAKDLTDAGRAGKWFDPASFPTAAAKPVLVPGAVTEFWPNDTWTRDASKDVIWYIKTFPFGTPQPNMRYYLRFGAVMDTSEVWLNGTDLGTHFGGEDPFEYDVTKLLQPGKPNTVAVRINLWEAAPSVPLGGIEQHVAIVAQPDVRIIDAFARPDAKAKQISLDVTIENSTTSPAQVDVHAALGQFKPARSLESQSTTVTVPPGQTVAKLVLPVERPHLWDLNDPFLYTIKVTSDWKDAGTAAARHDAESFRTGFRDFRMVNGYFTLNGRRILLKCLHGNWYDPVTIQGTPRDMTRLNKYFPQLKKGGFNTMRFIVSAAMPEQLDQADELGFMIYSEHQTSWLNHDVNRFGVTLNQIVRRDRNHPSLVLWGLLNETPEMEIKNKAMNWLPTLRGIDDTRVVILSSGRFDHDFKTASMSNPGSTTFDVYLGGEDPVSPKTTGPLRDQGGHVDDTGDDHIYPTYPTSWSFATDFPKLDQDNPHPFFLSECGVGSLYNGIEEKRQMIKAHAPAWSPSWAWINSSVDGVQHLWSTFGLQKTFPTPESIFTDSELVSANQRALIFSIVRSNPKMNGYNLTSIEDAWGGAEGVMNNFREYKAGNLKAMQEGWAPLRWCLLMNPTNVYADKPIHLKAALANEDVLPGGDYPATLTVSGPSGVAWKKAVVAHVQQNGPLAYTLFDDDVQIAGLKAGTYTFVASLDGRRNAAASKIDFTVTERASLPTITGAITIAGVGQDVRDLLTKQGAQLHDYAPNEQIDREVILVGPDFKGKAADWRSLYARAARGAHVIFLSGHVFHADNARNKWLALPSKGDQNDGPDWLYHKDVLAKIDHPFFAGLQSGIMTPEYYMDLLFNSSFFFNETDPTSADTSALSIYDSYSGGANFHAGLVLATYPFHAGHFTINSLNIVGTLGRPATDRLVLNMVKTAQADAAALAPLPADYDAEMDKLGFKD
jgi:hypothetical protein